MRARDLFSLGTVHVSDGGGHAAISRRHVGGRLRRHPESRSRAGDRRSIRALPDSLGRVIEKGARKGSRSALSDRHGARTDLLRLKRDLESGPKGGRIRQARFSARRHQGRGALDRRAVLRELERRQRGRVLPRRHHRRHHHRALEDQGTEHLLAPDRARLSRQAGHAGADRPAARRRVRAGGSLRRAGNRLRINAQLVDTRTDFPLWSERYDREMEDVFELQDEIARKIAEALRITLSPQEQAALSQKPTENLQAYDLYLRGKSYARRLTQTGSRVRAADVRERRAARSEVSRSRMPASPTSARSTTTATASGSEWIDRARRRRPRRRSRCSRICPKPTSRADGSFTPNNQNDAGRHRSEDRDQTEARLRRRVLHDGAGALRRLAAIRRSPRRPMSAIAANGTDYNIYVPILNALQALGKKEAAHNLSARRVGRSSSISREVPDDARARMQLAITFASLGRPEEAVREANVAMMLRPERRHHALQLGMRVLHARPEGRCHGRDQEGVEGRLQGRGVGAARSRSGAAARRTGVYAAVSGTGMRRTSTSDCGSSRVLANE